jgi:hypothetical protein
VNGDDPSAPSITRRPRDLAFRPERVFVSIEDSRGWLIRDIRYGSRAIVDVDVGDDHGPMERRAHRRQASRKRVMMTADEARALLVAWNQIVGRPTESPK